MSARRNARLLRQTLGAEAGNNDEKRSNKRWMAEPGAHDCLPPYKLRLQQRQTCGGAKREARVRARMPAVQCTDYARRREAAATMGLILAEASALTRR